MKTINYQQRAQRYLYGLSICCVFVFAGLLWLNSKFNLQFDWTHGARNTVTDSTQKLLSTMSSPIKIDAYFDSGAQIRGQVRRFVERYQRFKHDIDLTFVDTQLGTEELDNLGFTHLGQLKITYEDKHQVITRLNEQYFSSALFKLTRQHEPWVVFIQGHGERDPLDRGTAGVSKFSEQLTKIGIRTQPLNLLNHAVIPDNTKVLLIAGARNAFLAGELQLIEQYIEQGGNLLWLRDPAQQNYFSSLDTLLNIEHVPGVVIDANVKLRTVLGIKHPAVIPVVSYQNHVISASLETHSLFPFASAFVVLNNSTWQTDVLFSSLERSWSEVGSLSADDLTFENESGDTRGPLDMAIALSRDNNGHQQRIVLVGDSDFIANGYLGNGANLKLGLNIVNWLTQDENLMSITPRGAPDQLLELSDNDVIFIAAFLLLGVPILLFATGFFIRWSRYRN